MKKIIFLLLVLHLNSIYAQTNFRHHIDNDSTNYILNSDTSIGVSKDKVYYISKNNTILCNDFSQLNPNLWISDFDIVTDDLWYVLMGNKQWVPGSKLYKSVDRGATWTLDTSYYKATRPAVDAGKITNHDWVFQMQAISKDTMLLFSNYYMAAIFYSVDGGVNWTYWFSNQPANYRGLLECDAGYYLWSAEGDAFSSFMFYFDKQLLLSPNTNNQWSALSPTSYHPPCFSNDPKCIYAPKSITEYKQYLHYKDIVDSICNGITSINTIEQKQEILVYPNPSSSRKYTLEVNGSHMPILDCKVHSINGMLVLHHKKVKANSIEIELPGNSHGIYIVTVQTKSGNILHKILY